MRPLGKDQAFYLERLLRIGIWPDQPLLSDFQHKENIHHSLVARGLAVWGDDNKFRPTAHARKWGWELITRSAK